MATTIEAKVEKEEVTVINIINIKETNFGKEEEDDEIFKQSQ